MNSPDLVSICLPSYNVQDYIIDCIDSLLSQTYPEDGIIVCDDCSTDNTVDLLFSKYGDSEKIKIIRNLENKGVAYTRNRAFKEAKGKYIALMDADDICLSNRIEKQYQVLKSSNGDFCATDAYLVDKTGTNITGYWHSPLNVNVLKQLLCVKIPFPQPSIMVERTVFERFSYDEDELSEDYRLWTEIADHINYVVINEPLIKVRINPTSVSKLKLHPLLDSANIVRQNWISSNFIQLSDSQKNDLKCAFSQNHLRNLLSLSSTSDILYDIYISERNDDVSYQFVEQLYWMCIRHCHLSIKVPLIFVKNIIRFSYFRRKKIIFKQIMILSFLSLFKIEYGSMSFNKLKGFIGK